MAQNKIAGGQVNVALDDLNDVDTTGVTNGEVLTYNAGTWEAAPGGGGGTPLVKQRPYDIVSFTGSQTVGSAAHHNTMFRTGPGTTNITIAPDSNWTGTDQWFDNNYSPTNPGPMPVGGQFYVQRFSSQCNFIAGLGVTIRVPDGILNISRTAGRVQAIKVAPNEWEIWGEQLAA